MTIIRPAEYRGYFSFFAFLFFLFLVFGIFYIFEYNAFAASRLEAQNLQQKIVAFQSQNADLKNAYYNAIDAPNIQQLALENNLSLDKHPEYLNANLWLTDSSR